MNKEFAKRIYFDLITSEEEETLSIRGSILEYYRPGEELAQRIPQEYRMDLEDALGLAESGGRADGFVMGMLYASELLSQLQNRREGEGRE